MRKIYGKHHYPKNMSEILVGSNEQYETATKSVNGFKKFIEDTWTELAKYSQEELKSVGIEPPEGYYSPEHRQGIFKLQVQGAKLQINLWDYFAGKSVSACQLVELNTDVGRITGGKITADRRLLDFEAKEYSVGRETSESHFSFGFEDTDFKGIPSGSYIAAFLPHPTGKVIFDKEKGSYRVVDKPASEKPNRILSDKTAFEEYCNEDGTPYVSAPFVCTTYSSFETAVGDISQKTIVFQESWNQALTELRAKYKKPSGHMTKKRTPNGLPPALAMSIFRH